MPNLALSWREAAALSAVLFGLTLVVRWSAASRFKRLAPYAREAGVLAGLYALWQFAGSTSLQHTDGAFARARWIVRVERDWHLPSEARVQDVVIGHPWLVEVINLYYATMHFAALFVLLLWMFLRRRDRYAYWRTTIVGLTAACLLVQLLPVAPPRLLPEFGFVDTAAVYGQSVYTALSAVGPDQLSAMPSVHVGWAVLVAVAAWTLTTSRWRWLAVGHAIVTVLVVVATANHFWLDGIVATVVLAVVLALQNQADHLRRYLSIRRASIRRAQIPVISPDSTPAPAGFD
jgi:hypothetical protein